MTKPPTQPTVIYCGDLEIDRERNFVHLAGRRVQLPYMEFHVLAQIPEGDGRLVAHCQPARASSGAPLPPRQPALHVHGVEFRRERGRPGVITVMFAGLSGLPAGPVLLIKHGPRIRKRGGGGLRRLST